MEPTDIYGSETNCVRQPFSWSDVGQNKATVLINRINLFWGTKWNAQPVCFDEATLRSNHDRNPDLLIGCVDTRAARGVIERSVTRKAGCYQLVLDRKLGEYRLPDGWVVIAAGNPASERGVHFSMPRPLRNRFVHLDLEPDFIDWCKWAVNHGTGRLSAPVPPTAVDRRNPSQSRCGPSPR